MQVLKPSKNKMTGDPKSHGYTAYDFSGKGDTNVYSPFFGTVSQSKNSETRNWIANEASDPYKPATGKRKLLTEDYGNYLKVKGQIDGKTYYFLCAHMQPNTVATKGTEVKKGQVIGQIGNTGNSTGGHLHVELRDENNINIACEFVDEEKPTMETTTKEQIIIDSYKALTGEYPTDDEKKARIQQNLNTVELLQSLTGDGRFFELYVKPHIPESDHSVSEALENYKSAFFRLKEILKLVSGDNTEDVLGKVSGLVKEVEDLKKLQVPEVVYKVGDADYKVLLSLGNIKLIIDK